MLAATIARRCTALGLSRRGHATYETIAAHLREAAAAECLEHGQPRAAEHAQHGVQIGCTQLKDCTAADMEIMTELYCEATSGAHLAGRMCTMLQAQSGAHCMLGAQVDLFEHALQTATRAHRAGADDEMVVCALLHDVGELLSPSNHGDGE